MSDKVPSHLAHNVKQLRTARGLTQAQVARASGLPRPTWANIESGAANPTLSVLLKVASALQVPIEELIAPPRAACKLYEAGSIPERRRGEVVLRGLLPDAIPGMSIERMELPPRARMAGIPHMPGTREYLTCEAGQILLVVSGERWTLGPGDLVVFRGDQSHSYHNPGGRTAVGYSTVLFAPGVIERASSGGPSWK
ncbi:XRE family transcriptional regulator [bacterium]|nr:XRE family transcriptional regulator [bacterium]